MLFHPRPFSKPCCPKDSVSLALSPLGRLQYARHSCATLSSFDGLHTVEYEDSRFAYQIMGGLSVRASSLMEFRLGYRFRSSRGVPIEADDIEASLWFQF